MANIFNQQNPLSPAEKFRQRYLSSMQATQPFGSPGLTGAAAFQSRFTPVSGGQALGTQTTGGVSPARQAAQQTDLGNLDLSGFLEPTPGGPPSINYDEAIAPALESYSNYQRLLGEQLPGQLQEIETSGQQQVAGLQTEEKKRLGEYGLQRERETAAGGEAVAEDRRLAAEMQQGIQSRYGGTTGTGAFASEILGSQSTRNIAKNRAALTYVLGELSQAENNVKDLIFGEIQKVNQSTETQKNEAKRNYQLAVAEIESRKGAMQAQKADWYTKALQQYYSDVQGISARNQAFKQKMFLDLQDQKARLAEIQARAVNDYRANLNAFKSPPGWEMSQEGVNAYAQQAGVSPGFYQKKSSDLDELNRQRALMGLPPVSSI